MNDHGKEVVMMSNINSVTRPLLSEEPVTCSNTLHLRSEKIDVGPRRAEGGPGCWRGQPQASRFMTQASPWGCREGCCCWMEKLSGKMEESGGITSGPTITSSTAAAQNGT